jgi:hypothetical protein
MEGMEKGEEAGSAEEEKTKLAPMTRHGRGVRAGKCRERWNIIDFGGVDIYSYLWEMEFDGVVGAAVFAVKLLKDFLYRVSAVDPWTYMGVASLLLVVGSVAALAPARRAAAVEPMQVLREQ